MALNDYIEYWDDWHKEWFKNHPFEFVEKIDVWDVPKKNMGNEKESFHYFPEPYLLAKINDPIQAVFLNINPAKGGIEQIHSAQDSVLIKLYNINNNEYSVTISGYLGANGYVDKKNKKGEIIDEKKEPNGTAKWFKNKRLSWTNKLMAEDKLSNLLDNIEEYNSKEQKGKINLNNLKKIKSVLNLSEEDVKLLQLYKENVPNILCADLIPWHSNKASDIHDYIEKHNKQILIKVLVPLTKIANNIESKKLKNKIFVRGVTFRNILNNLLKKERGHVTDIKHYVVFKESDVIDEFNSLITVFTSNIGNIKTTWYIFTAGQSMFLPDLNYKYVVQCLDNSGNRKKLREFLLESNP
jgi:hypothetical protein